MIADQHVHSSCSGDGVALMKQLAMQAVMQGIEHLCITDHCDLEHYATGEIDPDCFDEEKLNGQFKEALSEWGHKISLCLGIELGGGAHMPNRARKILESLSPDLVIGSVHNIVGEPDFYMYRKENGRLDNIDKCREVLEHYVQEHFDLIKLSDFDVVGHIGYPLRYMRREGFDMDLNEFTLQLKELFKMLKEKGRGIEVNTAGLRNDFGKLLPSPDILRLYKSSGGEIITIGSDAHDMQSVGAGILETQQLLNELGFRYFTVYKGRKPEFIKL